MKRQFFVFSLPRSGSTWLSSFLSMPGSWCYHEPLVCSMTMPKLLVHMNARPEAAVGAIDTVFHNRPYEDVELEGARYYVIRRNLESVFRSQVQARMLTMDGDVRDQSRRLDACANHFKATEIHHNRFHDMEYMRDLWIEITGQPFDEERASYQMDFNVQHMPIAIAVRKNGVKESMSGCS